MKPDKRTAWTAWETISYTFYNFDFGEARSFEDARNLVTEGKKRWACTSGSTLALVDLDWVPDMWEWFLLETVPGKFVEDKGGACHG